MLVFTQPLCHRKDVTQCQFLSGIKLVWIKSFLLDWLPNRRWRAQFARLLNHSLMSGRLDGFMPFPRALEQTVSFRIWTLVDDFISYDDTHNVKRASFNQFLMFMSMWIIIIVRQFVFCFSFEVWKFRSGYIFEQHDFPQVISHCLRSLSHESPSFSM